MRGHREAPFCVGLLLTLIGWTSSAHAYRTVRGNTETPNTPTEISWSDTAWHVDGGDSNLPPESVRASVAQALTTWRDAECQVPRFSFALMTDLVANDVAFLSGDAWREQGYPEDAVGITDLVMDVSETELHFLEAHVRLDARRRWATTPLDGSLNLDVALAHEFGHALGLLHPCETEGAADIRCGADSPDALMNAEYDAMAQPVLQDDDRAALCSLYGPREPLTPPSTPPDRTVGDVCEETGSCLASECIDGVCRVASCRGYECTGAAFGASCDVGEDCATGLCLRDEPSLCTRSCGDSTCPLGFVCEDVDGASVCATDSPSTGCAAGGRPSIQMMWGVVIAVVLRRMRRRTENVR